MSTKTIDGFYIDTESGAYLWVKSLLDKDLQDCLRALTNDQSEVSTAMLRGRVHQINLILKKMDKE